MRFAFKTSPQNTTWSEMLPIWQTADDIEVYESGWTFDHFYPIFSDSTGPCLEGWITLTALAQATKRLRVGVLVTGIHYRQVNGACRKPVPGAAQDVSRRANVTRCYPVGDVHQGGTWCTAQEHPLHFGHVVVGAAEVGEEGDEGHAGR